MLLFPLLFCSRSEHQNHSSFPSHVAYCWFSLFVLTSFQLLYFYEIYTLPSNIHGKHLEVFFLLNPGQGSLISFMQTQFSGCSNSYPDALQLKCTFLVHMTSQHYAFYLSIMQACFALTLLGPLSTPRPFTRWHWQLKDTVQST